MRFGYAGTRWAQARNAQYCTWSAAFNQTTNRAFCSGAGPKLGGLGGGASVNMFNMCEYVPFTARMPKGFAEQTDVMSSGGTGKLTMDADSVVEQQADADEIISAYLLGIEGRTPTEMWRLSSFVHNMCHICISGVGIIDILGQQA